MRESWQGRVPDTHTHTHTHTPWNGRMASLLVTATGIVEPLPRARAKPEEDLAGLRDQHVGVRVVFRVDTVGHDVQQHAGLQKACAKAATEVEVSLAWRRIQMSSWLLSEPTLTLRGMWWLDGSSADGRTISMPQSATVSDSTGCGSPTRARLFAGLGL